MIVRRSLDDCSPHGRPFTLARAVPTYVLQAMALTHSGEPAVVDSEEAWQRAHLPEGFAKFVYTAG